MNDGRATPDIRTFHPGSRIVCAGKWHGVVVFNTVTDEYAPDYRREDWQGCGQGIMVLYEEIGLVFEGEPDEDYEIVKEVPG